MKLFNADVFLRNKKEFQMESILTYFLSFEHSTTGFVLPFEKQNTIILRSTLLQESVQLITKNGSYDGKQLKTLNGNTRKYRILIEPHRVVKFIQIAIMPRHTKLHQCAVYERRKPSCLISKLIVTLICLIFH